MGHIISNNIQRYILCKPIKLSEIWALGILIIYNNTFCTKITRPVYHIILMAFKGNSIAKFSPKFKFPFPNTR